MKVEKQVCKVIKERNPDVEREFYKNFVGVDSVFSYKVIMVSGEMVIDNVLYNDPFHIVTIVLEKDGKFTINDQHLTPFGSLSEETRKGYLKKSDKKDFIQIFSRISNRYIINKSKELEYVENCTYYFEEIWEIMMSMLDELENSK